MNTMTWTCQYCGQHIKGAGGIEIVNADPALGPVGRYPRRGTPEWEPEPGGEGELPVLRTLADIELPEPSIAFRVMHLACDPDPETDGYWIKIEDAATGRDWLNWAAHLNEKTWMGREDITGFLRLGWRALADNVAA
jgi:hypothetical protein